MTCLQSRRILPITHHHTLELDHCRDLTLAVSHNFIAMSGLDPLYYSDSFRLLFQHKLRLWRHVVESVIVGYIIMAAMHLLLDLLFLGPNFADLKVLETLIVLLAVVTTVIWILVFRDPHRFLHFHRPSNGYRWAVYVISAANTIPTFILHIQIIILTSKTKSRFNLGITLVMLLLFLCVSGVNLWMVRRFLLSENEEHYEPTVPFLGTGAVPAPSSKRQSVLAVVALEPYSGSFTSSSSYESSLSSDSHLSKAYAMQRESDTLSTFGLEGGFHGQSPGTMKTKPTPKPKDHSTLDLSEPIASGSTDNQPTSPLRCRTVARFDYMCQDRIGPHSWLSYLLIPVTLGIWSTVLFGLVSVVIYENNYVKFPSQ